MSKKSIIVWVLILVLSAVIAGCTSGAGAANGSAAIKTTLTDFTFEPSEWTVPAGQEITLTLTNEGAVEHDWVLFAKPVTPPASEESADVLFDVDVEPGETKTVTFTAPATAGEYQVVCVVPGHMESGMTGKLIVAAP